MGALEALRELRQPVGQRLIRVPGLAPVEHPPDVVERLAELPAELVVQVMGLPQLLVQTLERGVELPVLVARRFRQSSSRTCL